MAGTARKKTGPPLLAKIRGLSPNPSVKVGTPEPVPAFPSQGA